MINGWLGRNAIPAKGSFLFSGVHLAESKNLFWFHRSGFPVGSRDPWTDVRVKASRLNSELILCATLTLERYTGVRRGVYQVDCVNTGISLPRASVKLSHWIGLDLSWPDQWTLGLHLLDLYRSAAVVYTGRLHVALPCLAFGTPVFLTEPQRLEKSPGEFSRRFGTAEALGFKFGQINEIDVNSPANVYRKFLEANLNIKTSSKPLESLPLI